MGASFPGSRKVSMYEGRVERRGVLIDPTQKRRTSDGLLPIAFFLLLARFPLGRKVFHIILSKVNGIWLDIYSDNHLYDYCLIKALYHRKVAARPAPFLWAVHVHNPLHIDVGLVCRNRIWRRSWLRGLSLGSYLWGCFTALRVRLRTGRHGTARNPGIAAGIPSAADACQHLQRLLTIANMKALGRSFANT